MWPHIYDTHTNMAMMWCYVAHMWHFYGTDVALGNALGIHNDMWDMVWTHGHHHIGLKMCMQLIWIYDPMLTIIQFMKEERNGTNKKNCLKVK